MTQSLQTSYTYICACSFYSNKRFRFKTVISRSLPSFNSAHGGTRGGDMLFSQKHLVNNYLYVLLIKSGTLEVTLQYFAYFISISSLVFENDKWTFWGCFGHFNMSHLLKNELVPMLWYKWRTYYETNTTVKQKCDTKQARVILISCNGIIKRYYFAFIIMFVVCVHPKTTKLKC